MDKKDSIIANLRAAGLAMIETHIQKTIKPDLSKQFEEEEVELPEGFKWRNLHFQKVGRSYLGKTIFNNPEEANKANQDEVNDMIKRYTLNKNYSHAIQIPIKS